MKRIAVLTFSLLGMIYLGAGCKKQANPEVKEDTNTNTLSLDKVQQQNIGLDTVKEVPDEHVVTLTGKVSFDEDKVAKVYPLVGGNVIKVNVSLGDVVKRGQVLAVLRSGDINDLQTQHEVALTALQTAKKNLGIAEELFRTNVNSEKDLIAARVEYKRAESEVKRIEKQLSIFGATANSNNAEYNILAPVDGYIVEKNVSENMDVRSDAAQSLFTVSFLQSVWVLADVYESDVAKVHLGDSVDVSTVAYPDRIFRGKIANVGSILDPDTKTMKVRVVLDNSEGLLKPEMFAIIKVHYITGQKVLKVPTKSVVLDNSKFNVVKSLGGGKYEKQVVNIDHSDNQFSYLSQGVHAGDVIVSEGSLLVANSKD